MSILRQIVRFLSSPGTHEPDAHAESKSQVAQRLKETEERIRVLEAEARLYARRNIQSNTSR